MLQLHKLGVLETGPAPGAKKPSANEVVGLSVHIAVVQISAAQIEAREVVVPFGLQQSMTRLLADLNITPVPQPVRKGEQILENSWNNVTLSFLLA